MGVSDSFAENRQLDSIISDISRKVRETDLWLVDLDSTIGPPAYLNTNFWLYIMDSFLNDSLQISPITYPGVIDFFSGEKSELVTRNIPPVAAAYQNIIQANNSFPFQFDKRKFAHNYSKDKTNVKFGVVGDSGLELSMKHVLEENNFDCFSIQILHRPYSFNLVPGFDVYMTPDFRMLSYIMK